MFGSETFIGRISKGNILYQNYKSVIIFFFYKIYIFTPFMEVYERALLIYSLWFRIDSKIIVRQILPVFVVCE